MISYLLRTCPDTGSDFKFGGVNLKNECRMVRHRINRVKGVLSGPELA